MSKRVLVTGGAGFIGSHLVDRLADDGFEVVVFDNLSTGRMKNIKRHLGNAGFSFVKGDIRDKSVTKKALKDADAVFHLAAITSVPYSVKFPRVAREVNVDGTRNLLEACLEHDVERLILVSSCAVYGEPQYLPIDEKHPLRPISPYAETKLEAERLCMEFRETYGLKTTILRPFNVYGPRMRGGQYGGVIAHFIERIRLNRPPIIYGDGEQTRDFVHIKDAVSAMILSLESGTAVGKTFNIATGASTSINRLANLIIELSGAREIKPQYRRDRRGDIKHSYADIKQAKVILGYEPKIRLREGLLNVLLELTKCSEDAVKHACIE